MRSPKFFDLQVSLMVNGAQLDEYNDEDDEEPCSQRLVKYVESTSGTNFTIKLQIPRQLYPHDAIECRVYLDGKYVIGLVSIARSALSTLYIEGKDYAGPDGETTLERFAFAQLNTNDGPAKPDLREKLKDLGTIELRFVRAVHTGSGVSPQHSQWDAVGSRGVPEKSLKGRAISNQATLSKPETVARNPPRYARTDYPYGTKPFLTAIYKYRSRRDLQVEGIIPRSPSPMPLEDRDPDDLTPEEARELVRRLRERQVAIKQEFKMEKRTRESTVIDEDSDDDVIVTSDNHRQVKRPRLSARDSGVEIVDLTDD